VNVSGAINVSSGNATGTGAGGAVGSIAITGANVTLGNIINPPGINGDSTLITCRRPARSTPARSTTRAATATRRRRRQRQRGVAGLDRRPGHGSPRSRRAGAGRRRPAPRGGEAAAASHAPRRRRDQRRAIAATEAAPAARSRGRRRGARSVVANTARAAGSVPPAR
jgi:hypothetical protein